MIRGWMARLALWLSGVRRWLSRPRAEASPANRPPVSYHDRTTDRRFSWIPFLY